MIGKPGEPGMGYFYLAGEKLSAGLVEQIKSDPAVALKGERGCGYKGCRSTFWESLEAYSHNYPREVMCQARESLHPVVWAFPDDDGCKDHPESSVWSHPNMSGRMTLKYLEKSVMSKFRSRPSIFSLVKNDKLGKTSNFLLDTENWIVLTYRQLLVWGKVRDFEVDLELEEVGGMPTDLIVFAKALKGAYAGSLPGPEAGVPKVGVRALKVKMLVNQNKISKLQGKRTYEQMSSGSREFDSATKRSGTWKPTIKRGPIPVSPREDPLLHFTWLSTVGESTMGEVTLCSPDNSSATLRVQATRS